MMTEQCELVVIIGSHNRPKDLSQVLVGISELNFKPDVVVICDSSDVRVRKEIEFICAHAELKPVLLSTIEKSLTRQKNLAIEYALQQFNPMYIQILDDDTVPSPKYTQILRDALDDQAVIGSSGAIYPYWEPPHVNRFKYALLNMAGLISRTPGIVTKSGVGMPVNLLKQSQQRAEWLFGCSMWKASIFRELKYDNAMQGSCLCEDVEFSVRASKYGALVVDPRAHLFDLRESETRVDDIYFYRFVRNRLRVISQVRTWKSYPMFALSIILNLGNTRGSRTSLLRAIAMTCRAYSDQLRKRPLR